MPRAAAQSQVSCNGEGLGVLGRSKGWRARGRGHYGAQRVGKSLSCFLDRLLRADVA